MENEKQKQEIETLSKEIKGVQKILTVLGDETRQRLILIMLSNGNCTGMRVNDIAEKTNLSRPAVSHHLQILKDAGIVKMRREGTKNYYFFNTDMDALNRLISMLQHAKDIMLALPDWSENENKIFER